MAKLRLVISRRLLIAALSALVFTIVFTIALFSRSVFTRPDDLDEIVREGQTASDTGRPEEALRLFAKAASMAPEKVPSFAADYAWAYLVEGYASYMAQDWRRADECYAKTVEIWPEMRAPLADAWVVVRDFVLDDKLEAASRAHGRADWEAITKYARATVEIAPDSIAAHYFLGLAYQWSGARERAAAEYRNVAKGSPASSGLDDLCRAAKAVHMSHQFNGLTPLHPLLAKAEAGDFATYEDTPFIVHHHNIELAKRTARALKYYLSREGVGGFLPALTTLPVACHVYLFRNSREMAEAAKYPSWQEGYFDAVAYRTRGDLTLCLAQDAPGMLDVTAAHELGHVRMALLMGREKRVPLWLEEGIASAATPLMTRRFYCEFLTGPRAEGKILPASEVMRFEIKSDVKEAADIEYAECMAIASILAEKDANAFRTFVSGVKKRQEAVALKKAYNMTLEDLDKSILIWAEKNRGR